MAKKTKFDREQALRVFRKAAIFLFLGPHRRIPKLNRNLARWCVGISRRMMMHPAMALWMWSLVMCRICQATLMGKEYRLEDDFLPAKEAPLFVRANAYLISDLANHPLPDSLLDRLSDLYWTEREAELAI
jgi:hypothetical protein